MKHRRIHMQEIRAAVAAECGVRPLDLVSGRRDWKTAHARQLAMYLGKELTPLSLAQIGRLLGGRDHTTVLHGIRAVSKRRRADPRLDERIWRLKARLLEVSPPPAEVQLSFLIGPLFDSVGARP